MKALILAAGYATRLYPLTKSTAKPMLEIVGKPIINHILNKIHACKEVETIYVVTNEKFYQDFCMWKACLDRNVYTREIIVVNDGTHENGDRLGAIGDMDFVVRKYSIDDDLLIIAGDNIFSFLMEDMLSLFRKKKSTIVAVYDTKDKKRIAKKLGCVEIDKENKVTGFEEKPEHPKTTLAATACYLYPKNDLRFIEAALGENHFDRPGDLIKFISERKPVYAFQFEGYWYDIGTPEEYKRVNAGLSLLLKD